MNAKSYFKKVTLKKEMIRIIIYNTSCN